MGVDCMPMPAVGGAPAYVIDDVPIGFRSNALVPERQAVADVVDVAVNELGAGTTHVNGGGQNRSGTCQTRRPWDVRAHNLEPPKPRVAAENVQSAVQIAKVHDGRFAGIILKRDVAARRAAGHVDRDRFGINAAAHQCRVAGREGVGGVLNRAPR